MADTTFRTVLPALKAIDNGDGTYSIAVTSISGTAIIGKVRLVTATGDEVTDDTHDAIRGLEQFGGAIYENQNTASADNARRFETSAKKLRDVVIQVSTNAQLLGGATNQRYVVGAGETIGFTKVDISTLYFKNATAGQNGTVNIIGVEE